MNNRYRLKKYSSVIVLLYLCMIFCSCKTSIYDLEDLVQDFVLDTKKIEIPSYPKAFNPSIIRWNNKLLMTFRVIPDRRQSFNSLIYTVWLDDNFNPITQPTLLDTRYKNSKVPSRAEDSRLVEAGGRLYLVYSDCKDEKITKGGFRVNVAEVIQENDSFYLQNNTVLSDYEGADPQLREKNWVPFDFQGNLMLSYSLEPHRVFMPIIGTNACETISCANSPIKWDWGVLRGGTTALSLDDKRYLSFFHSSLPLSTVHSDGKVINHYVMGAYTFSKELPFEINEISPEPIVGKGFYHGPIYQPYWSPVRVVFPCGFVMDENYVWVSYGRQDHEAWIVKMDKKQLLASLKKVSY